MVATINSSKHTCTRDFPSYSIHFPLKLQQEIRTIATINMLVLQ